MNTTLSFVILALCLCAAVSGVILWALLRPRTAPMLANQQQANTAVYRDQLADLALEHAQGALSSAGLAEAQDELKRRLLDDTATPPPGDNTGPGKPEKSPLVLALTLALLLPLAGLSLYGVLGQPQAMDTPQTTANSAGGESRPDVNALVDKLAKKLEAEPNHADGWVLLGRAYRSLQRGEEALQAYDKAVALSDDSGIALARAELLADLRGGKFDGEPWRVIQGVLKKDPKHFSALLLAGSAAYTEQKYADALRYWERARAQKSPDPQENEALDQAIAQVRELQTRDRVVSASKENQPKVAKATLSGQVSLAPALQSKVAPTDTVFVYATPIDGSRMPLAIVRSTVSQLPLNFTLDDSSAMNPQRKLSGETQVTLKARISKSGNAMAQAGDLIGTLSPVSIGSQGLRLVVEGEAK